MDIPRLHPDTIDLVKQRVDIVDLISEHIVLRKQGKDFVGLCPFHDDKSPSFSVSPSKQFYYCFSCGAGGNGIKFLMELNKRSFADVVLDLAKRYQVPVKTLEPQQRQELQRQISLREQLYEVLALTARFYEHALHQSQGEQALLYLRNDRHLTDATIQQFQLGYAPSGWQTLYGYLVEQKRYPVELVEQAGLIIPRQGERGYYDRFRHRLMIPIHDLQGRVIGFGGRALGDEQPKYLNSPETELFDKGKTLFALDKARTTIAKQDQAIVVEGYFDVIALHTAGITNAVASLGTALSLAQVRQLLRYTESKQVVLNFDADAAGTKAAERAIGEVADLAYKGEVQLRVLNIPDGKDPDEFLKIHTPDEYQALIEQAPLWLDWQIQQTLFKADLSQADQFQQATQEIVQLLGQLPNATLRTHYIHTCAELLSQGNARLTVQLESDLRTQVRGQRWHGRSQKWQRPGDRSLLEESEAQLLRLYLHLPETRLLIRESLEERDLDFSLSHHRFLWQQILYLEESRIGNQRLEVALNSQSPTPSPQPLDLISQLQDHCAEFPDKAAFVYELFQLDEKTRRDIVRAPLVIRASIASIERVMCEKRRRHFLDLWKQTDCRENAELSLYYQQQIYAENQRIAELDQQQRQTTLEDIAQLPWAGEYYATLRSSNE
ncbi:DNA primase [Thermocoleostomius sinensis]|uniref:DNA primase n=1 Tax=Thermocoleostomius sinensis A174 TaxID=2016057 RepID=A0A9E9C7S2_9CYAN|nr:DNA primase [Thermocoleostomius sinensis]WAL59523.1 DNA primase [Thermocoleostomius sinensis A174]